MTRAVDAPSGVCNPGARARAPRKELLLSLPGPRRAAFDHFDHDKEHDMIDPPKPGVIAKERARRAAITDDERWQEDFRLVDRAQRRRGGPPADPVEHRRLWDQQHGEEAARARS